MEQIFLFADESGNSGTNLFDMSQPYFYIATLFSDIDMDSDEQFKNDFLFILGQREELHYNEINNDELISISEGILDLFTKYNISALLTEIEKSYLPKIHFFDTFFDSGINPHIDPIMYGRRMERFFILFGVLKKFSNEHSQEFYTLWQGQKYDEISLFIQKLHTIIIKNESKNFINTINPILNYAKDNPEKFLPKFDKKYLLPNFHALPLIMHYTREKYPNKKAIFKHDHNSKIFKGLPSKILEKAYNFDFDTSDFSLITDIRKDNSFSKGIEFIDSKNSYGIQLSDFIVSFFKSYNENKINKSDFTKMSSFIESLPRYGISEQITINEICSFKKYV